LIIFHRVSLPNDCASSVAVPLIRAATEVFQKLLIAFFMVGSCPDEEK
jgi:hypothetical protein